MNPPTLSERLRQSAVFQAVALFLGASWVVLQVVDLLIERLGLPGWTFTATLALLGVGLVVVLATAWVQSRPSTTAAEESGDLPSDWEVAPSDVIESLKAGRLPHLNWARAAVGGVVSLSLLFGFAGLWVLVTGGAPGLGPSEAGADEGVSGIAILPFSVNDPEFEPWGEGIVDLLAPGLDGVAGYRTIASRTMMARWNEAADGGELDLDGALEVAGATGARYAITGNVVALGSTVRLTAELYDLADGAKVAEGSAEGSSADLLEVVDELGLDTMRDLMRELGLGGETLPARLTTTSLAAARAFLDGEDHFRAGRYIQAVTSYEEAMAADSTFALPSYRAYLALLYVGNGEQQRAMEARLLASLDDLPARDRTLARLRLQISGDSVRSVAPAERAVVRYPDDAEAWYMLGEVRYHEPGMAGGGHGPAREAFERAVELAPGYVPYYYHPLEYAIGSGDRDRAEVLMGMLEAAAPEDGELERFRLAMEIVLGPLDLALQRMDEDRGTALGLVFRLPFATHTIPRVWALIESLPVEGDARASDLKSAWAMTVGRQEEALRLMQGIPLGNGIRLTLARHHQEVLGEVPGIDLDAEFDVSHCTVKDVPIAAACYEKAALRAVDAGRFDFARRIQMEQDSVAGNHEFVGAAQVHRRFARTIEGYLAWKQGDLQTALEAFRETRRLDEFAVTARWYLAEVLVETGQSLEAVDLFLSIDNSPTWSSFARLRAAEILESMGDSDRAVEHYEAALAAWVEADENFTPAERAQAGLARVAG